MTEKNRIDTRQDPKRLTLVPHGHLGAKMVQDRWTSVQKDIESLRPPRIVVDGSDVTGCDGVGIAFLLDIQQQQDRLGGAFSMEGFPQDLLELIQSNSIECDIQQPPKTQWLRAVFQDIGCEGYSVISGLHSQIAFLGELLYRTARFFFRSKRIPWPDLFLLAEKAGANGVGITSLLGFLIGLILAFQSAIALEMFGAEIYVADLVVLCMFRELGPLITAFIVASRSGSAYAAELGTMKVNEELDALKTSGLDPIRFLVVPRMIALIMVVPVLTLFNNFFSLMGAQLVMSGLGYAPNIFWDHVTTAAGLSDLVGGLIKTFVFGFLIAAIGCFEGLKAGQGASAVGNAATRAVVSCMVMLVAVDFIFAIIYYALGI